MSKKLINFVDISKSYGNNLVLDELNLYIRENELSRSSVHQGVEKQQRSVF